MKCKDKQKITEEIEMEFKIEKVSNMIFITGDCDVVFKEWDETEFTERKLKNAMNKLNKFYCGKATFIRMF